MRPPVLANLIQHEGDIVRWNREAEADRAAGRRFGENLVIDTDHLALHVEQRSAGIAVIDRGVDLNELVVRRAIEVAVQGADDARRDGALAAERVADRQNAVSDTDLVTVADLDRRKRIRSEERRVGKG